MLNARSTPAVAGSFLVGGVVGAALSAAVLVVLSGLLSPIPTEWRAAALLAVVAFLALRAAGLISLRLPQNSRQIPREVFLARPARAAFRFSLELGTSVRTYVTTEAPYALAMLLLLALPAGNLSGAIIRALLAALGFGIGRALIISSQILRSAVIVEHPRRALHYGNWLTLVMVAVVAGQQLQ